MSSVNEVKHDHGTMKIVPKEKALACPSSSGAFNWGYEVIDLGWFFFHGWKNPRKP